MRNMDYYRNSPSRTRQIGRFPYLLEVIKDVPDGGYTLVVWHEGAKNQSKPVTVAGATKADLTVSK